MFAQRSTDATPMMALKEWHSGWLCDVHAYCVVQRVEGGTSDEYGVRSEDADGRPRKHLMRRDRCGRRVGR